MTSCTLNTASDVSCGPALQCTEYMEHWNKHLTQTQCYVCKPRTAARGTCSPVFKLVCVCIFFFCPRVHCARVGKPDSRPKPRCVHPQKMLPAGGWGLGRRATLHRHAAGALVAPTATRLAVQMGSIIINCAIGTDDRLGSARCRWSLPQHVRLLAALLLSPDRQRGGMGIPRRGRPFLVSRPPEHRQQGHM